MDIILNGLTKKYKQDTIFRDFTFTIKAGDRLGISGPNGSGKSTLLKILSGQVSPTKGERTYLDENGKKIEEELVFGKISYAAPYIELIEEYTLPELLRFYANFRQPYLPNLQELAELSGLKFKNRFIKEYSSGMKQRVKLLLALCFQSEVVLLDEPSTNLDAEGVAWTNSLITEFLQSRTIIIASNEVRDFEAVSKVLDIVTYK